ncbi:DNA-directed RNA polymerase subunit beta [Paenibacillus thalictri]|uniref:DNA-directed RNA polymerase subunit beta n=1 Tax=Paenibacillus thalictri TaxID=2527873 RepID=A0A4Q9DIP9_9BACL|nr:DNA-directed RNA polymerase subunit beta [Paenibacillus thalictri]TBL73079.1 DNA-directed RNA polymerase subunit beta [Paenibacillus thalictri]
MAEQPTTKANKAKTNKKAKPRARWKKIVWFFVKLIRVPVLCAMALVAGLYIGYVYMGGQQISDVFELQTWKHMVDLVFAAS